MYIPADFQEISVILDQAGRVPGIKQVSIIAIFLIEHPGVMVHHRLHDLPNRVVRSCKLQVKMVRHQAICVKDKRVPVLYFLQQPEEKAIVIPVAIDHAMSVAPSHDVVTCSFIPFSLLSRLAALFLPCMSSRMPFIIIISFIRMPAVFIRRDRRVSPTIPASHVLMFSCPAAFL